jgi:hypothetical protein
MTDVMLPALTVSPMSPSERYLAAIEHCVRKKRVMWRHDMRRSWVTMEESYRLLQEIKRLGILSTYVQPNDTPQRPERST